MKPPRFGESNTDWVDAVLDRLEPPLAIHDEYAEPPHDRGDPRDACDTDLLVASLRQLTDDARMDCFGVLCLSGERAPLCWHQLARGTLDRSRLRPADIFRAAIVSDAAGIVLAHARAAGCTLPRPIDLEITADLVDTGFRLAIPILDHLVIGPHSHASMRRLCPSLFMNHSGEPRTPTTSDANQPRTPDRPRATGRLRTTHWSRPR